jgi:predicted nucleotidyltransferase component of viral defense system
MNPIIFSHLQLREIFHLEFLRRLGGKLDSKMFAVKGGANLRFFFQSIRYSEDLDLDVRALAVERLKDIVLGILRSPAFGDHLKPFGIEEAHPPDIARAKQTETTQRFKIHLLTKPGEDLFTKIEFSRRGFQGTATVEAVADPILRFYKIPPLWAPHYDLESTIVQKVEALASRAAVQARDIFDLHLLIPQGNRRHVPIARLEIEKLRAARERIFEVGFDRFRDTVLAYLSPDDQKGYDAADIWDGVRMQVADFLEAREKSHA